jgi:SAM-dependent methyltransferase
MIGTLRQAVTGFVRFAREVAARPAREAVRSISEAPLAAVSYPTEPLQLDPDPSFPDLRQFLQPGALVLDLGCGPGRNLPSLEEQGFRIVGVDQDPDVLGAVSATVPLLRADLFELPLPDASVDGVVAWQVLCQFPRSRAAVALAECHRVLKPDGLLVLSGCAGSGSFAGGGAEEALSHGLLTIPGKTFAPIETRVLPPAHGWHHARWLVLAAKLERV